MNHRVIVANGLTKRFQGSGKNVVEAVADVSLAASPGQVFGILGANGAGKTTLLRILSTVIRPTSGTATVAGADISAEPEKVRASIGFLSGSTSLYGRLTARECLAYFGRLNGLSGRSLAERLAFVSGKFGLSPFLDSLCDRLSTGQRQRVNIARSILHDPPVLFLDEPTAGLDVLSSQSVMEFIEESRDEGKTVVFSTHIMTEAERLCDEVAVIHRGKIVARGAVPDLRASHRTLEEAFLSLVGYERGADQA
jgi:sodium transport system ATP-binding protein